MYCKNQLRSVVFNILVVFKIKFGCFFKTSGVFFCYFTIDLMASLLKSMRVWNFTVREKFFKPITSLYFLTFNFLTFFFFLPCTSGQRGGVKNIKWERNIKVWSSWNFKSGSEKVLKLHYWQGVKILFNTFPPVSKP